MKFQKIHMETWERAEIFRHFIEELRCVMNITVQVDITRFLQKMQDRGWKFYPAMIWVVSAALNSRPEFRMGYDEQGNVGIWDEIYPYYAHFYPEDQHFAKLVTPYAAEPEVFYQRFLEDMERYKNCRGFDVQDIPPNTFDVSCLPWNHYQSFDMHIFDEGTYLAPVVTWGKYQPDAQGKIQLPLTLNIHHAVADGFHLCRFFQDVETFMEHI